MSRIWDFWAKYYDRLWVQTYSLGPTRRLVIKQVEALLGMQKEPVGRPVQHLDVGCGSGQLIAELIDAFTPEAIICSGIDASVKMIEQAGDKGLTAQFYTGDAHQLPFDEASFDLVTCCHSLPYYHNQPLAVQEFYRVLRPGGLLFLVNASVNSFYDKVMMSLVKVTTGPGNYPSKAGMRELAAVPGADLITQVRVPAYSLIPSLILTISRKRVPHEGITG